MKFVYHNAEQRSGIYTITNICDGKIYIGSAKNFFTRSRRHFYSLKNNKHHNRHLQAAYNLHGTNNFIFEVVKVIEGPAEVRREIEEEYFSNLIQNNLWKKCYNFQKSTSKIDNSKQISLVRKGKTYKEIYGQRADEIRYKISKGQKGKKLTKEHKEKISLNAKTNPNYGLKNKHLSQETKNKIRNSRLGKKHWHYGRSLPQGVKEKLYKTYNTCLLAPTGEFVTKIFGITKFCKEYNLSPYALKCVILGKRITHKGWTLATIKIFSYKTNKQKYKKYICCKHP